MNVIYKKLIIYGSIAIIIIGLISSIIIMKQKYKLDKIKYEEIISGLEQTNKMYLTELEVRKDWDTITNYYTNSTTITNVEKVDLSENEIDFIYSTFNSYDLIYNKYNNVGEKK